MRQALNRAALPAAVASAIILTVCSVPVGNGVREALRLCTDTLIPSLFPFMIAANMLSAAAEKTDVKRISFIPQLFFGLSPGTNGLLLCALFGGYPTGTRLAAKRRRAELISERDGKKLTGLAFLPAPAFVLTAVGRNMFASARVGIVIYLSVILGAAFCGFFFSFPRSKTVPDHSHMTYGNKLNIPAAVDDAARGMFGICLWTVVYGAIKGLLSPFLHSELAALSCVSEVTAGCLVCAEKNDPALAAAVCAFGGLCVHLQIYPSLKTAGCRYVDFFLFRICHAAVSYAAARLLLYLFPFVVPTLSKSPDMIKPALTSSAGAVVLLLLCCLLVLDTTASASASNREPLSPLHTL